MKRLRLSIVGFGVVGQGLAELLHAKREQLLRDFAVEIVLVGVANSRHGFIYREEGLNIPALLELVAAGQPLTRYPDAQHWDRPLDGLRATDADILAEATWTNLRDAEPGLSHIRVGLEMGMHVVVANKGPVALAAQELFLLAQQHGVQLRMEATVMAGTPVLSTIREGMAGVDVQAVRGILNGTTNYMLTAMAQGRHYEDVLAEAQAQGYAEADPTADVEGYDAVAKALILAALVFDQTLKPDQVKRTGITTVTKEHFLLAKEEGKCIKLLASLVKGSNGELAVSVEPVALPLQDPLARIEGVMNAITFQTDSLGDVTVVGPGAGRLQTGQGLLADIIAIARSL